MQRLLERVLVLLLGLAVASGSKALDRLLKEVQENGKRPPR
jgi:hypothetical protein